MSGIKVSEEKIAHIEIHGVAFELTRNEALHLVSKLKKIFKPPKVPKKKVKETFAGWTETARGFRLKSRSISKEMIKNSQQHLKDWNSIEGLAKDMNISLTTANYIMLYLWHHKLAIKKRSGRRVYYRFISYEPTHEDKPEAEVMVLNPEDVPDLSHLASEERLKRKAMRER